MLDTNTRRRIDTARDILVGKVPDPKSQVEQITIALIYKFMDDMDAESEEFGGERSFFAGDFARYGWTKLMRAGLGGHEVLNLYAEAISRMPENPGIPPLFRDIFKNAYLPYRDPETLRAFLKVIDEFNYDHSEKLGDAFEYLLSVLGSQGDAGQFRTPRHIIDFIVEIVDPKKSETVLDPACGTAGFLISSYKHIMKANRNIKGESTLTPDEKGRLAQNFKGYDISPDMVRLSLVNMYLHGFADPHIYEYDTLTSQERWNDYADVILANPPFMSPKGGIKPHNRFSVQSKRSEVLFVDYMAEHLTPNGRAGIIVPEGIIFQSGTAYKQLRKMLVEEYLVAVVSLPAGVFNPYSGVKTSILILDKSLAKKAGTIAFYKVENDGYGLGAQRREIDKNDLPQVLGEINEYLGRLRNSLPLTDYSPSRGQIVEKTKIAANEEYNLSGERYRESNVLNYAFPLVRLGDICVINPSKTEIVKMPLNTRVSFVPMSSVHEFRMTFDVQEEKQLSEVLSSYTFFSNNDVLLAKVTPCFENGKAGIAKNLLNGIGFGSSEFFVLRTKQETLPEWIYFCLMHEYFRNSAIPQMTGTGGLQRVPRTFLENFQIPLPPLDIQKEIVAEIEGYQKVIDGARAVVENYKPHIVIDPEWPMVELGEIIDRLESGVSVNSINKTISNGEIGVLKTSCVTKGIFDPTEHKTIVISDQSRAKCNPKKKSIIISRMNTENLVGANAYISEDYDYLFLPDRLWQTIISRIDVNVHFIQIILASDVYRRKISSICGGTSGSMKNISKAQFLQLKIPLPSLKAQNRIVDEIEAEQKLVNANKELIERFEKKIQAILARVWGEDKPTI